MSDEYDEMQIFDHYIKKERQIIRHKKMDNENRESKKQQPEISKGKSKMKILYLMYGMGVSGGARIIYEHANRLIERGYDVEFHSFRDYNYSWFPLKANINKNPSDNYDAVFATYFETYYPMIKHFKKSQKYYLVQGKESLFFTNPEMNKRAARTQNNDDGVHRIAIARHLVKWLQTEFGVESLYLPNGLDLEFYKPTPAQELNKTKFTILLEGGFASKVKGIGGRAQCYSPAPADRP